MNTTHSLLSLPWGPAILVLLEVLLVAITFFLGARTALLRDDCPGVVDPTQRTYSMAKTQLAFWSVIIIGLFVWMYFDSSRFIDVLNGTALVLLGISAGTAALSKVVGDSPTPPSATAAAAAAAVPPGPQTHVSFLVDILSDKAGMNIHRMQMLLWTVVFGFVFIAETVENRMFPSFDDKIYGLMGISSGTYVWFKRSEA